MVKVGMVICRSPVMPPWADDPEGSGHRSGTEHIALDAAKPTCGFGLAG